MKTLCFTGHRKLFGQYDDGNYTIQSPWTSVFNTLTGVLKVLHDKYGFCTFISGGAIGVDQLAAECVNFIKGNFNYKLSLVIAKPFPSQGKIWPAKSKMRFNNIVHSADKVVNVSESDPANKFEINKFMQDRNIWMVDNSDAVIAIYNDKIRGGTDNCVKYAISTNKNILVINPVTLELKWL